MRPKSMAKSVPNSGLLIRSICDTLVKLSVRGPAVPALAAAQIEARVSGFVRDLLNDSDDVRWLSLSSLLPDLAEAAPEAFLRCVETSLSLPNAPVTRLLTETGGSGFMGRCWHAGLLWGLERLAWAPERLARVALLLARFALIEIKGNGRIPRELRSSICSGHGFHRLRPISGSGGSSARAL